MRNYVMNLMKTVLHLGLFFRKFAAWKLLGPAARAFGPKSLISREASMIVSKARFLVPIVLAALPRCLRRR